jgi:hypothetical protein
MHDAKPPHSPLEGVLDKVGSVLGGKQETKPTPPQPAKEESAFDKIGALLRGQHDAKPHPTPAPVQRSWGIRQDWKHDEKHETLHESFIDGIEAALKCCHHEPVKDKGLVNKIGSTFSGKHDTKPLQHESLVDEIGGADGRSSWVSDQQKGRRSWFR